MTRARGTGGDLGLASNSDSLWIHRQNNISNKGPLHLIHSSRGPEHRDEHLSLTA